MSLLIFFFFPDPATTEIYTLSLHDALPISEHDIDIRRAADDFGAFRLGDAAGDGDDDVLRPAIASVRSEEHTSELQSQSNLVCRLLLEKKNKKNNRYTKYRSPRTTYSRGHV